MSAGTKRAGKESVWGAGNYPKSTVQLLRNSGWGIKIEPDNCKLEIIQHFSVKRCLCPVQFWGIQWYLLMSWHVRALYFFHLISPLICIMLPMKEVLWKSGLPLRIVLGKPSAIYHQSALFLRRIYSLIIPLFGVLDQFSCSPVPVVTREMSQELEAVWRAFLVAWEPSVSRCLFVPQKLWEPLQSNITEAFHLDQKVVLWPRICSLTCVALCAKFMSGV